MGQHGHLAGAAGAQVGGGAVQPHPAQRRVKGRQPLGQQRRQHPGQHVAAAAPGQPRVAGGVLHQPPVRRRHQRAGALEHRHAAEPPGAAARRRRPVGLHRRHRGVQQPGHLAGVGGQQGVGGQAGRRPQLAGGQGVQGVGVQHRPPPGGPGAQQRRQHLAGGGAQPRPGQQHGRGPGKAAAHRGRVRRQNAPVRVGAAGQGAAFRRAGQRQRDDRLHPRQVHKPGAGAQRPFAAQRGRPPVGHAAGHRRHPAETALVGVGLPPGQPAEYILLGDDLHSASLPFVHYTPAARRAQAAAAFLAAPWKGVFPWYPNWKN